MRSAANFNSNLDSPLQTFRDYVGLKLHFNDPFIWNRNFKSRIGEEQLLKRRDAYMFIKLSEEIPDREERIQRLISAFKKNPATWVGEVFEEDHKDFHKKRMAVVSSLQYSLRSDIDKLVTFMDEHSIDVRKLLVSKGNVPYIIKNEADIPGGIKDETLALIEKAFKFCSNDTIDPLWQRRAFMLTKYHYWLNVKDEFLDQQLSKLVANPGQKSHLSN